MQTITLKTAYTWQCPICFRTHYAQPVKPRLSEEEREEAFRHYHDLEPWSELPEGWEQFEVVAVPKVVKCTHCQRPFETQFARI